MDIKKGVLKSSFFGNGIILILVSIKFLLFTYFCNNTFAILTMTLRVNSVLQLPTFWWESLLLYAIPIPLAFLKNVLFANLLYSLSWFATCLPSQIWIFIQVKYFFIFCLDGVGHCVKFLLEATGALSSAHWCVSIMHHGFPIQRWFSSLHTHEKLYRIREFAYPSWWHIW